MRSPATVGLAAAVLTLTTACGDRPDVDFGGRDIGPELFAIVSTDGTVRLGLTDSHIFLALTDDIVEDARQEVRRPEGENAGRLSGFIERTVDRALQFRALYDVDAIDDVRWEDGELRVDFNRRSRGLDETFRSDDRPVTRAFAEEDVREFSEEFRLVKQARR